MSTATALDWDKAIVEAPDAKFQMALVHFNPASQVLSVKNRVSKTVATYQLTEHTLTGDVLTGRGSLVGDDAAEVNDIRVQPDSRCTCIGFKRTAR